MPDDPAYVFGHFTLDMYKHQLLCRSTPVHLEEKQYALLLTLVRNPGRLVTRDELVSNGWNGDSEDCKDVNLNHHISRIRQALNDDPNEPTYIETVKKLGYRFKATVRCEPPGPTVTGAPVHMSDIHTGHGTEMPGSSRPSEDGSRLTSPGTAASDATHPLLVTPPSPSIHRVDRVPALGRGLAANAHSLTWRCTSIATACLFAIQAGLLMRVSSSILLPLRWFTFFAGLLGLVYLLVTPCSHRSRRAAYSLVVILAASSWVLLSLFL